jgi:hypothetical protein
MNVAYVTTDEVNENWAQDLAAESMITLSIHGPQDAPHNGEFDAVVYDWDFLPPEWRHEVLAVLLATPPSRPVAVHGYHLPDEQISALRANGVHVYRHLTPEVFQALQPHPLSENGLWGQQSRP